MNAAAAGFAKPAARTHESHPPATADDVSSLAPESTCRQLRQRLAVVLFIGCANGVSAALVVFTVTGGAR